MSDNREIKRRIIRNFLTTLKDIKSDKLILNKLERKNSNELLAILLSFVDLDYEERQEFEKEIIDIVSYSTALFLRRHKYDEARRILENYEMFLLQKKEVGEVSSVRTL